MSVDFSSIIENFLTAELGEEVRGSLVEIARALQNAINSQLNTVTDDLTNTDPNAALRALVVSQLFNRTRLTGMPYSYGASANELIDNGLYFSSTTTEWPQGTIVELPFQGAGWLEVTRAPSSSFVLQVFYPFYGTTARLPMRRIRRENGTWTNWIDFSGVKVDETIRNFGEAADAGVMREYLSRSILTGMAYVYGASANELIDNGLYFSSTTTEWPQGTIVELPYQGAGWLYVIRNNATANPVLQVFFPYENTGDKKPMYRHRKSDLSWTDWRDFGGNGDVVNEYNYEINENTYNVTATPTISTGIPYVLTSTGDTTDRTADIAAVLAENGFCMLGTGTFYVSNLPIGENQSLRGSGIGNTILRMADTARGNAVTLGSRSSISELTLFGGAETMPTANGERNGIGWQGTYISPENEGSYPYRGQISNVWVYGFSGAGIICSNTSMNIATGLNAVNVNIFRCWAGVYIPIYSEYHRFTNIEIDGCYYGVVNNGGNNMFANCGFNANQIGFYIDNSSEQSPNNSHGSAVGCTFNHSGGNNGTAIKIDGASAGYVFSACQIFYGKLDIKDSVGIIFTSCNIGLSVPIEINDGGVVLFNSNLFRETPTVTKSNSPIVITNNCYIRDTGETVTI